MRTKLIITSILLCSGLFAQKKVDIATVNKAIDNDKNRLIEIYKDFHQNPELGFSEVRTSKIVADNLKKLGYEVKTGIAKTGVVAIMKNGSGPIVMYRADMDANAVKETTGLPYASKQIVKKEDGSETPVMHACGHDEHTTWMLGVAKFMAENKSLWKGTVIFVGQPAEELILGAEAMVNDGMYTKHGVPEPDFLFGMHTAPIATGMVVAANGVRMAGTDQFDILFHGVGGHGSTPNLTKDPIIMATNAITQYQGIISRAIDPKRSAVITIGSIQAGSDNNVIPSSALVKVNLRWFKEEDRKIMLEGIKRINEAQAYIYNLPKEMYPEVTMKGWSYPLDNDKELTETVREGLKDFVKNGLLFDENQIPSVMGSEDFGHLVIHNKIKKYCYLNVGIAEPARFEKAIKETKSLPFNAHNGDFEVDLNSITYGTKVGTIGLLSIFNNSKK